MPRRPSPRRKPRLIQPQSPVAQPAPAEGGNMAAEDPADAATTIDLATLTAEICTEGGFTATTP